MAYGSLAFLDEVTVARRHTRHIHCDLPRAIREAVARLPALFEEQRYRIKEYRARQISDMQFHDLAIRAVDAGVVSAGKLPKVIAAFRSSPHAEFQRRTVWSAFNAFTEVVKEYSLFDVPMRTQELHGLCGEMCILD